MKNSFAVLTMLFAARVRFIDDVAKRQGSIATSLLVSLAAGLFILCPQPGAAQEYPTRPIRLVVPFAPGGGADIVGRIIGSQLAERLGQSLVVDNRAGAGSTIGTNIVTKALADGYTLLVTSSSIAINPWLYKQLAYNAITDLEPVVLVAAQPNILVFHPSVPATSIKSFVEFAHKQSGKLNYASPGVGTTTHLTTEMLKQQLKIDMTHVPFKGTAPAISALISGEVQVMVSTLASALPHIRSGRLHALGITSVKRSAEAPDIPTLIELGVPDFDSTTWYALFAPAGTRKPIVDKLNAAANLALELKNVKQLFITQGLEPLGGTPAEQHRYLKTETEKWGRVIRAAGVTPG